MTYAISPTSVPDSGLADSLLPAGPEQRPTVTGVSAIGEGALCLRIESGRTLVGVTTTPPDTVLMIRGAAPDEPPLVSGHPVSPGVTVLVGPETDIALRLPAGTSMRISYVPSRLVRRIAFEAGVTWAHAVAKGATTFETRTLAPIASSGATTLAGLASALRAVLEAGPPGATRDKIDSSSVVRACAAYVDSTGHVPTMRDLCLVAHVSERRLRTAFTETVDMPPTEFFRYWQLSRIHDVLESGRESVTTAAIAHGVRHHGRFSGRYHAVFGEYPRDTLAAARRPAASARRLSSVAS